MQYLIVIINSYATGLCIHYTVLFMVIFVYWIKRWREEERRRR